MFSQDQDNLELLISRYQQRIFALVLNLIGGNRDKAYEVVASSFVEAIRTIASPWEGNIFLSQLAGIAVHKSRDVKIIPTSEEAEFMNFPPQERASLRIVKAALQKLPFDTKALLLLRDQLHLPYKDISSILRVSQRNARRYITQARIRLRENIEKILESGR